MSHRPVRLDARAAGILFTILPGPAITPIRLITRSVGWPYWWLVWSRGAMMQTANRDSDMEFGSWLMELTRIFALLMTLILIIVGAPSQPGSAPELSVSDEWRRLLARLQRIWGWIVRRRR